MSSLPPNAHRRIVSLLSSKFGMHHVCYTCDNRERSRGVPHRVKLPSSVSDGFAMSVPNRLMDVSVPWVDWPYIAPNILSNSALASNDRKMSPCGCGGNILASLAAGVDSPNAAAIESRSLRPICSIAAFTLCSSVRTPVNWVNCHGSPSVERDRHRRFSCSVLTLRSNGCHAPV